MINMQAITDSSGDDTPRGSEGTALVPGRRELAVSAGQVLAVVAPPTAAQMQRAAEAALLGASAAHPLCPVPAGAQPTMSQLLAMRDATSAALEAAAVQAARAEQQPCPTSNSSLGMVAAAFFGAELQGSFEAVGKRIAAAIDAHTKNVCAANRKLSKNIKMLEKRHEGDALAGRTAAATAEASSMTEALLAKAGTKVLAAAARSDDSAAAGAGAGHSTALVAVEEQSAGCPEAAAQALTSLAGSSSERPREWSCPQC